MREFVTENAQSGSQKGKMFSDGRQTILGFYIGGSKQMHITCQKKKDLRGKQKACIIKQQDQGGSWKLKGILQKAEVVSEKGNLKRT